MLTVWMDAWQLECCGEHFGVGSQVTWTLVADPDWDFLRAVLGEELATSVTHWEDHHDDLPEDVPETTGIVRSIRRVRCRYAADPRRPDGALQPVEGSASLAPVDSTDGPDPDAGAGYFVGYLIELEAA